MLLESKKVSKMKQEFKNVYYLMKDANNSLSERNYEQLAQTLIDLKSAASGLKSSEVHTDDIEQQAQVDLIINSAERLIEDIVTDV